MRASITRQFLGFMPPHFKVITAVEILATRVTTLDSYAVVSGDLPSATKKNPMCGVW